MDNIIRGEEIAALALRKVVPDAVLKTIVQERKTIGGILGKPFEDLLHMGFDLKTAGLITSIDTSDAEASLRLLHDKGGRMLLLEDPCYPPLLKEIYDPPACLYVLGDPSCLHNLCISVVGARKATKIGEDMAKKLGSELAAAGVTVVSGFAYGIDICSHLGALHAGGKTAAVLGSGIDEIYPSAHKRHIENICRNGCLVTEFDPDEKPMKGNFPKRNRIVSGLSRGVVIVEASSKSGSLITCRMALEQGRDVFAVPASPLFANNATNSLIKGGAILIECAADVLGEYYNLSQPEQGVTVAVPSFSTPEERAVYDVLSREPLMADEIVFKTGLKYTELAAVLMTMELSDRIEKNSDGRYTAKRL